MVNFLKSLSRHSFAIIVIVFGIVAIVFFNPPARVCVTYKNSFLEKQKGFLILDEFQEKLKRDKFTVQTHFEVLYQACLDGMSSGSCVELFSQFTKFLSDLSVVSSDCLSEITLVKEALSKMIRLITVIAWESGGQVSASQIQGWLNRAEVYLYCQMTKIYQTSYADEWEHLRESVLAELKPAKGTGQNFYEKSLFSVNCHAQ